MLFRAALVAAAIATVPIGWAIPAHADTDQERQYLAHLPASVRGDDFGHTAALNDGHMICSLMPAGPEQPGDRSTVVAEYISLAWKNYGVRANESDAKSVVNAALDYLCPETSQ